MNKKELFKRNLEIGKSDRVILTENMGFWPETYPKWYSEGLAEGTDLFEYFGMTQVRFLPVNFNFIPSFERKVMEETDEYLIVLDETNTLKKEFKNSSAMPHYISFPIKEKKDFYELKERLNPKSSERYPANWSEVLKEHSSGDFPTGLVIRGPFAFGRDFIDFNELMMLFYDDPDFIKEMMDFQADFTIKLWEKALKEADVDVIWLGEDMAYKNGPMISPAFVKELLVPNYKKITTFLRDNGVENIFIDSDGNIESILPLLIESGFNGISPVEIAANMDLLKIRDQYPDLKIIGGVNKLNIAKGEEGIDYELKIVEKMLEHGSYIPSFDHSVPPIVSFKNYSIYIEKLKNLISN